MHFRNFIIMLNNILYVYIYALYRTPNMHSAHILTPIWPTKKKKNLLHIAHSTHVRIICISYTLGIYCKSWTPINPKLLNQQPAIQQEAATAAISTPKIYCKCNRVLEIKCFSPNNRGATNERCCCCCCSCWVIYLGQLAKYFPTMKLA